LSFISDPSRNDGADGPEETEAEAAQDVASNRLEASIAALCDTPARSIRDLQVKARATKIDEGGMFERLERSIVDDVLALDGG
jgi:hypothetical protein